MNRKFLNDLFLKIEDEELRKELTDKIMDENGKQIEKHKTEVATIKNELKVKEGVIENLNAKIKENNEIDIEAIKKESYETGFNKGNEELKIFKQEIALNEKLKSYNAKDIDIISKLLEQDKITYEEKDGKYEITGIDEQIEELKTSKSYLFESENKGDNIDLGGTHEGTPNSDDLSHERKILGLE